MRKLRKLTAYLLVFMMTGSMLTTPCFVHAADSSVKGETTKKEETTTQKKEESGSSETTTQTPSTEGTTSAEESTTGSSTAGDSESSSSESSTADTGSTEDKKDSTSDKNSTSKDDAAEGSTSSPEDSTSSDAEHATVSTEDNTQTAAAPDYSMPTIAVKGNTFYEKDQLTKLKKQKKAIAKKQKELDQLEESCKNNISAVENFYVYVVNNKNTDIDVTNYLLGKKREQATEKKSMSIVDLDGMVSELAQTVDNDTLRQWTDDYTLEYTYGRLDLQAMKEQDVQKKSLLKTEDDSSLKDVLDTYLQQEHNELNQINQTRANYKEQLASVNKQIKECKKNRVFNPKNVTKKSRLTVDEATRMLEGTNLQYLAKTFVQCEEDYGVNAVFLMAIAAHESAWGTSRRAVEDHNYTGYGVYSDSAKGINSNKGEANIIKTAEALATNYLNPSGKYYSGLAVNDVHKKYCATGGWSSCVVDIAYRLMAVIIEK